MNEAERAYAALLNADAGLLEAYSFLAMAAHQRRDHTRAISLLERALKIDPSNSRFLTDLGLIYRSRNHLDKATDVLTRACRAAPENYVARLYLGTVAEKAGRAEDATRHYFAALEAARLQGEWQNVNAIRPNQRAEVIHAAAAIRTGQRAIFDRLIDPLRSKFGKDSVKRVEKLLAAYLGDTVVVPPDPRQRPLYFYFPDIPSQTYFTRDQVPWVAALEDATDAIRDEAAAVVADGELPPFLHGTDATKIGSYLSGTRHAPSWDAFFFYRDGARVEDSAARAPRTAALLETLPLVRIAGSAPEICFSLLTPGTVIEKHSGVANFRIVVHLPLLVPQDCALNVGGELHAWQEGRCVAFDDTFVHEAWNRDEQQLRVVLLLDAWNPHLTDVERVAVTDLVTGIRDFNRRALEQN